MPFEDYAATVLKIEDGLVDDPNDPGGLTNYGISHRAHPYLTRQDIIDMTPERAMTIYENVYWKPIKGERIEQINESLGLPLLDMSVHSGPAACVKCLQRTLQSLGARNVKVDGLVGPMTLSAIASQNPVILRKSFLARRMIFLSSL